MARIEPVGFAKLVDMAIEEPGPNAMRQVIETELLPFDILIAPASKGAIHVAASRGEPARHQLEGLRPGLLLRSLRVRGDRLHQLGQQSDAKESGPSRPEPASGAWLVQPLPRRDVPSVRRAFADPYSVGPPHQMNGNHCNVNIPLSNSNA